jgi:hypothetical protein
MSCDQHSASGEPDPPDPYRCELFERRRQLAFAGEMYNILATPATQPKLDNNWHVAHQDVPGILARKLNAAWSRRGATSRCRHG